MLQWREAQVAKVKVHAFTLGLPEYFFVERVELFTSQNKCV